MSATADKARYFLEQSVPELKEYERKKIFGPDEITSIAKKRSDFEHKINARGSSPSDYAQYAEFEINVDTLRRKRVKRLGVKSTTHNGQRRVHFVLDRGTRKFPGDVGLWMQSIEYARRQKAYKKLTQIFTNVLRLHPTKSTLWIYAARFAVDEHGDMTEARSYMQRSLRFCKNNKTLWLEYVRLELAYLVKIYARRRILGIGTNTDTEMAVHEGSEDENILQLPKVTAEDVNPDIGKTHDIDQAALQNLDNTPVMSGAIPQAIFDSAMRNFNYDGALGHAFFNAVVEVSQIPATLKTLDHICQTLESNAAEMWQTQACHISRPLVGLSHSQPEYPAALRDTFKRAREALSGTTQRPELLNWYGNWLRSQEDADMDIALQQVISAQLQSLEGSQTIR